MKRNRAPRPSSQRPSQPPSPRTNDAPAQIESAPRATFGARGTVIAALLAGAALCVAHRASRDTSRSESQRVGPAPRTRLGPGPSHPGLLEARAKELPVPAAYIDAQDCRQSPEAWRFEGRSLEETLAVMSRAGLDATQRARVSSLARCDEDGCSVFADAPLVWSLSSDSRSALYGELARFEANRSQQNPHYRPLSFGAWSAMPGLTPQVRDAIAGLTWTRGDQYALSDIAWLCAALPTDGARALALATLRTRYSLDLKVRPPPRGDLSPLVRYWSLGDDERVMGLFEEARHSGEAVAVRELLPPLPRALVDTYPSASDQDYDCFWSAVNFFSPINAAEGLEGTPGFDRVLRRRYVEIPVNEARYGDMLVLWGRDDVPVHAVNLIADDVVYTKNGAFKSRPWSLMHLREVSLIYPNTYVRAWRRREA